jgi:mediator of RNA polymerase II transcription subunit 16
LFNFSFTVKTNFSFPDVDKVLLNLEAKDFTVEPSLLQSLQQLIQWVADLALNILVKLPENRAFGKKEVCRSK